MEPGAVTGWIPIGDVSPVSGGLLYLEGSREMGLEIERTFLEMNKELDAESQLSAFNQNVSFLLRPKHSSGLTHRCSTAAA